MVANLVQIQDKLKDLSDNQLRTAYSQGTVPQFLVMTEMGRRKEMKEEYQKNQAQGSTTVAEDILSPAANMARGLGAMAQPQNRMATQPQNLPIEQSMATMPPSPQPMANKLPVTRMADGGLAKIKARNGMSLGYDPSYLGALFPGGSFSPEAFRELYLGQVPANQQRQSSVRSGLRAGSDIGAGTFFTPRGAMEAAFPSDMDARTKAIEAVAATYKQPSIFSRIFSGTSPSSSGQMGRGSRSAVKPAPPSVVEQTGFPVDAAGLLIGESPVKKVEPTSPPVVPVSVGGAKPSTVDISSLLPKPQASPAAGFNTPLSLYEDRLRAAAARQQPEVTYSSSLTSAEAAAKKALTDAQAGLTADSAYKDLATALTDRRDAIGGQRDEAAGLALLEAAARIAGSKSPFITQAIGEAAPAIASYGKSLSEVRKQENALFDAEAKLTQLEVAEAAGRKDEVSKLRGELRDLDKVRRDIDEKAFNRFEKTRNLEINVIKAEQQFATARTTEARENARFQLSAAKDEREKNSLANQLGETQANIIELEDLLRSGKSRGGQPLTDAEKAAVQDRIGELKTRGKDIAGLVKSMKGDDLLTATRKQELVKKYNAQIDSIKKTLGYGVDTYISQAKIKGLTEEEARKEFDNLKQQQAVMQREINSLLNLSGVAPAGTSTGALPNVNFKVKKPSS
jgi:hypothetical protein|tara:strand:+ start:5794 stop:7839 length:2046 start_codon:yes stop_codon:yes gene_type:complete